MEDWLSLKTFRRQVPVRPQPLRGQFHLRVVVFNDLTESEVANFDLAFMKENVDMFKIKVNDFQFVIVQIQILESHQ